MPVTTPDASTVATAGVLLLQAPPAVPSVSVVVLPEQTGTVPPPIAAGAVLFTVSTKVVTQPGIEVAVILVVPVEPPDVNTPVPATIEAIPGELLDQVQPAGTAVKVVVEDIQIPEPPLTIGDWLTVTITAGGIPQPFE